MPLTVVISHANQMAPNTEMVRKSHEVNTVHQSANFAELQKWS